MRVKIRGLVFVGFAAAVFAQSAMADATTDAKTVTSKLYVDQTFQTKENIVTTTEAGANGFDWTSETTYPSIALLNQVQSQVTGIDVNGDETYINVADNAGTFTVSPKLTPATANSDITGDLTDTSGTTIGTKHKLVTAGAVKSLMDTGLSDAANAEDNTTVPTSAAVVSYAEKKANKATSISTTSGGNYTSDTAYPTTKAVYDFVTTQGGNFQPKVDEAATTTMYVGKYVPADGNTSASATWDKLTTGTYVANTSTTAGTYTLDVPAAKITSATSDFAASGDTRAKLATAGTVYDFVNGNYQAKAAANTNTVQVGYNGGWGTLGGSTYVTVDPNSGSGTVSLTNLTAATSDFVASGDSNAATNRPKLAKAGDVYDFVTTHGENTYQPKVATAGSVQVGYLGTGEGATAGWKTVQNSTYVRLIDTETSGVMRLEVDPAKTALAGSTIAGSTGASANGGDDLTTAWAVKEYVTGLTGGLTIPSMPETCTTAATNGGYCALVYGNKAAQGQTADYGLQWTVMAPVPTNP